MTTKLEHVMGRLRDERGKKVMFVSHCVLNENVRYWGGAFRPAGMNDVIDELRDRDIAIVQMKCPGQVLSGAFRQRMVPALGSKGTWFYSLAKRALPFVKWRYRRILAGLARDTVKEMSEYQRLGMKVMGVVGVSGSPFCSVNTMVDFDRSFEFAADLNLEQITRDEFNDGMEQTWVPGEAMFISALRKEMARQRVEASFLELDLAAERRGETLSLGDGRSSQG